MSIRDRIDAQDRKIRLAYERAVAAGVMIPANIELLKRRRQALVNIANAMAAMAGPGEGGVR